MNHQQKLRVTRSSVLERAGQRAEFQVTVNFDELIESFIFQRAVIPEPTYMLGPMRSLIKRLQRLLKT